MLRYPLDTPGQSLWTSLFEHPYPAKPAGLPLSDVAFKASLQPLTPILLSAVYLFATTLANRRRSRSSAPRDMVKASTTLQHAVLAHNVFLCLYSGWTAVHVISILAPYFYQGAKTGGASGFQTALCTVPTHDASSQGLLRFITLFYYSKFYEVVDSIILILKGKKVSNLQVYHHSGAMLTMWAGVRYSASPIWLFAAFNGTIHACMYAWYAASSLKLPIPGVLKRGMTTLQIAQLISGGIVAFLYLFMSYNPLSFPQHALPSLGARFVLPEERDIFGNASNATLMESSLTSSKAYQPVLSAGAVQEKVAASLSTGGTAPCVSSSGQAFAVALNVAYLVPLITLFVRFYIRSYLAKKKTQ